MKTTMKTIIRMLAPKKLTAAALALILAISLIPFGILLGNSGAAMNPAFTGKAADTQGNTDRPTTLAQGQVWTGKNVTYNASTVKQTGTFGVELSALGKKFPVAPGAQYDVVFVLDASGSMDAGRMSAMVNAANGAFDSLLLNNPDTITAGSVYNRFAVVKYSSTASVIKNWTYDKNYSITAFTNLVNQTNIVSGLACAKDLLAARGRTSIPVIILLTDGAPNRYYNMAFSGINSTVYNSEGSGNGGATGDATSAAFTVLYANWLKKANVISNLKIYTVGFEIDSSSFAKEVLNITTPIPAGSSILTNMQTAKNTGWNGTTLTDYRYVETNGAFSTSIGNLSTLLPGITGGMGTGLPTAGDLVLTDRIGPYFSVEMSGSAVKFSLDGIQNLTTTVNDSVNQIYKYTAANGVKVEFNLAAGTVTYTIPNTALKTVAHDDTGFVYTDLTQYSSLKFNVVLKDTATTTDRYYFTNFSDTFNYPQNPLTPSNGGCDVSFTPAESNPYYYAAVPEAWQNVGSGVTKTYQYSTTQNTTTVSWNCQYDNPSGTGSDDFDSITIDGHTYSNPNAGSGGNFSYYNLSQNGSSWTVTFTPTGSGQPTYSFTFTAANNNNKNASGTNATKTLTTNVWKDTKNTAATSDDTSIANPTFPGSYTGSQTVTVNGETFTGAITGSVNSWTITGSKSATTAGNVIEFTVTRGGTNGDTVTVMTQEKTLVPAHSSPLPGTDMSAGTVARDIAATGWIVLDNGTAELTIKKSVTSFGNAVIPIADIPAGGFEFTLTNGPSAISLMPYTLTGVLYNANGTVKNAAYQFTPEGKFYLNDGEYIKVSLTIGTQYSVMEKAYPAYKTTSQYTNASGPIATHMNDVVFINTYYPTATFDITKNIVTLYDSVNVNAGITFNFELYYKNSNDEYVKIPVTPAPSVITADSDADSLVDKTYTVPVTIRLNTLDLLNLFGSGSTATIYLKEAAPSGAGSSWILDESYHAVVITNTGTVTQPSTVTNKYQPTAQLSLTKNVDVGSDEKSFDFDIEIGAPSDTTYQYSYAVTVNGTAITGSPFTGTGSKTIIVSLKDDETAVVTGIPVGSTYTVKEDDYSGTYYYANWAVDANGRPTATGTIAAGNNAVGITNTHERRDLTIEKHVAGIEKAQGDTFTFTVKDSTGATAGTLILSPSNNYIDTLEDLFVGETYTVTETGSTVGEYKTAVQKTVGTAQGQNGDYNSSTGYSFILEKNDTTLLFTNTFKEGQLTVTKSVNGTEPVRASAILYGISVTFTGSNLGEIICMIGDSKIDPAEAGIFNISLPKDGNAVFSNIPDGATYTVTETDKKTADSVAYTYSDSGKKITDGDHDTVTVTNTYDTPSVLTITKDVPDSGYDRTAGRFDFSISFFTNVTPEIGGTPVKTAYTLLTNELPTINPGTAAASVNFSKVEGTETVPVHYIFTLADDEQLVFTDLPVGVSYEVTETATQISSDPVVFSAGGARSSILTVGTVLQSGLTATGDIQNDAAPVNVTYANYFNIDTGSLTLNKSITGDTKIAPASYDFTAVFTGQMNGIKWGDNTGTKDETAGTVTFNVTLSQANGYSVKFDGLKGGTEYTITERTGADSTVFTGADRTAIVDGKSTASGTMLLFDRSWQVTDKSVTCTNHYTPPSTTTVKDAYKTTTDGLIAISGEDADNKAIPVSGVYVGDTVTYVITVTNSGPKTLRLDYIFDVMFGSISTDDVTITGPEGSITAFSLDSVSGGNALVLTNGLELASGDKVTVTYTTSYNDAGPKTNTATSYATYSFNYNGTPGTKTVNSDDDAKINVYYHSDLTLVKDVAAGTPVVTDDDGVTIDISGLSFGENATVDYLDDVTYRLTITNIKEAPLNSVTITDYQLTSSNLVGVIKNGSVLAPSAYSINADYLNASDDHTLTLTGNIQHKDVIVILYTLNPTQSNLNTAIVNAFDGLNTLEKEDTANVTVLLPTITVTKTAAPSVVITGDAVSYTVTITNNYDRALTLGTVKDSFFTGLDASGYNAAKDYTVTGIKYINGTAGTAVDIDLDDIATASGTINSLNGVIINALQSVIISYSVRFNTEGGYKNTVDAAASYRELTVTGTADKTVRVKDPSAILVTKLVNDKPEDTVLSGSTVTYTVAIENKGKAPIGNLTLTDPLFDDASITGLILTEGSTTTDLAYTPNPMSGSVLTITPPAGIQQGELTEPPAPNTFFFNPGSTIKLTYTAVISATYTNTVLVNGLADTEDRVEEDASANVTVYTPPVIIEYGALTVDKTVSGNNPSGAEKFAFTVTFTPGTMNILGITNSAGLTGANGVYTFSLSANDTPVTFSNIPLSTNYTVTEALTADQGTSGWIAPTASSGTITTTALIPVTVNNVYDAGIEGTSDKPETDVAGDNDKLPQTGGISSSTLLALFGLALISTGGTTLVLFRKKKDSKSN